MKTSLCFLIAALLAPSTAFAEGGCQSFDKGEYPLGHILSEQQRQQLTSQGPGGSERGTLHCSRDGKSCSVQSRDGTIYRWIDGGKISSKAFVLDNPSDLPGWKGRFDAELATHISNWTCSPFRLETSDAGLTANDKYLKNESQKASGGQDYVTTIFGDGTPEEPIMIELSLKL